MTAIITMKPEEIAEALESELIVVKGTQVLVDKVKMPDDTAASLCRHLAQEAAESSKKGWEHFTRAAVCLWIIKRQKLHNSVNQTWGQFRDEWIDAHAKGRTEFLDMLKAMTIWVGGLQRPLLELFQYEDGVGAIVPLFCSDNRLIASETDGGYNRNTGEIGKLADTWEKQLDGQTPQEFVNGFVDTLPKTSTRSSTERTLRDENPSWDISIWKRVNPKNGSWHDISWEIYRPDGSTYAVPNLAKDDKKEWGKGFANLLKWAPEPILKMISRRLRCQGILEE